jgi:SNF2 family DNA or RNA helicase
MIAADTIEEKLSQIIQNKQSVLTSTLDGEGVEQELTIFDELQNALI